MFGILTKIKKLRKKKVVIPTNNGRPSELYGVISKKDAAVALVFTGNGAASSHYEDEFARRGFKGVSYDRIGGKADYSAILYLKKRDKLPELFCAFEHEAAQFAGFILRRKINGRWHWLGNDNEWHLPSDDDFSTRLFREGERPDIPDKATGVYVFEAKWRDDKGTDYDCGWKMYHNELMAHSFGGMNGKEYHNTLASFDNGIKNGYKYFETDLSLTVDDRLVLCHGWSESNCKHIGFEYTPELAGTMTYDKVMSMQVHGNPIMDAREFYQLIKKYPEYTYEIDFHSQKGEACRKRIRNLLQDFENDEEVFHRLLMQVYNKDMYRAVESEYHFVNYQYLLGAGIKDMDSTIDYLVDEGICAVGLRAQLAKPAIVRKLRNAGIYILAYTVKEDALAARKLLDTGVNTICTDYITYDTLAAAAAGMSHYPFYISYNSGDKEADHGYEVNPDDGSEVFTTTNGLLEFRDMRIWDNDGTRHLEKCAFTVPGKTFKGWKLRMKFDNKWFWYCEDGFYHKKKEYNEMHSKPRIFADEELIPVWTVKNKARLIMVAVWE